MDKKFLGYKRSDGSVGTRNYVLVLAAMDSSNPIVYRIGQLIKEVIAIPTSFGRGQLGKDYELTVKTLAGLAKNPNIFGVLIVSLEPSSANRIAGRIRPSGKPVETVTIQEEGSTLKATQKGIYYVLEMCYQASKERRQEFGLSKLVLGVECGGSDATSGIVTNPCLGLVADRLVDNGGTAILSETSEWMGAEHVLANRAINNTIASKIINSVKLVEEDAIRRGVDLLGQQPAADNIKGGLSTIEEKSLGSIAKGGSRSVQELLENAAVPPSPGFYLMETASPAAESMASLSAGGCNIIIFSTGQGNTICSPISPTIKVCGNPQTVERMKENIDVDISDIIYGKSNHHNEQKKLYNILLDVASGTKTRGEIISEYTVSITRIEKSV